MRYGLHFPLPDTRHVSVFIEGNLGHYHRLVLIADSKEDLSVFLTNLERTISDVRKEQKL